MNGTSDNNGRITGSARDIADRVYANLEPDEPRFVLSGRDRNSVPAIKTWIAERRADIALRIKPMSDLALVEAAEKSIPEFERYARERAERLKGQSPMPFEPLHHGS